MYGYVKFVILGPGQVAAQHKWSLACNSGGLYFRFRYILVLFYQCTCIHECLQTLSVFSVNCKVCDSLLCKEFPASIDDISFNHELNIFTLIFVTSFPFFIPVSISCHTITLPLHSAKLSLPWINTSH